MPKTLEFFYDFNSTYSYLASTQLEALGQRTGALIRWRPFLLSAVFKATENVPPFTVPTKGMYLAKDLQDWSRHYGLPPFILPTPFPFSSVKALRVALVAEQQGLNAAYTQRLFRRIFNEGKDAASPEVLAEVLREVGMAPEATLARAEQQDIKDLLRANTDDAVKRGAFGAPTWFIGEDMYVGNDRLLFVEKALRE